MRKRHWAAVLGDDKGANANGGGGGGGGGGSSSGGGVGGSDGVDDDVDEKDGCETWGSQEDDRVVNILALPSIKSEACVHSDAKTWMQYTMLHVRAGFSRQKERGNA